MNSEVAYILEFVGPNYLSWKRKIIDVLRSKNVWRIVNDEHKKLVDVKDVSIWEDKCDQERGFIVQTVAYSLQVSIEGKYIRLRYGKLFLLSLINLMLFLLITLKRIFLR